MPRKPGGIRKKRRTHKKAQVSNDVDKIPRSFVFRRGSVPNAIRDLVPDLRTALMPHTAIRLKESKKNTIRDYVAVGTQLGITHFWILSATSHSPFLRIGRLPQGPTLTFRIVEYSLAVDVRRSQRRPITLQDHDSERPPLLVMNNFIHPGKEVALMAETFRHSFPPIDVNTVQLSSLRRVLLVHRDEESGHLYLRHYALKIQQAGLSRPVRKMVNAHRIPKLGNLADISQVLEPAHGVFSSDSEVEGDRSEIVTLAQPVRKLRRGANSSIKLTEVGPRLTLELIKAQAGLCDGAVLYHRFFERTEEEATELERRKTERETLKRKRREEQEANVKKKEQLKRAKKERRKEKAQARVDAAQRNVPLEEDEVEANSDIADSSDGGENTKFLQDDETITR